MLNGIRQKVARGLSPLLNPETLDSNETSLEGLTLSGGISVPVLQTLDLPSVTFPWDGDGFMRPPNVVNQTVELEEPSIIGAGISEELQLLRASLSDTIGFFDEHSVLMPPQLASPKVASNFEKLPEIVDFFDELLPPQVLGRVYAGPTRNPRREPTPSSVDTERPNNSGRCRHGLRFGCGICKANATPQRPRRRPTRSSGPDVFDQLRFVLQPPLLERLHVPGVIPDGRAPYPFQVEGIRWLLEHPEGLLADEMGLGKTMQAILAMRVLFNRGELRQALVVAPASVGATWEREIAAWAPELTSMRVQGNQAERDLQWRTPAEVHIVSYESLRSDMQRSSPVDSIPFDLCIADEAQKIKNPAAAVSGAVRSVSAKCQRRWALTGTPLENSASDAVSIFGFIAPGLRLEAHSQNPQALRSAISPHSLRRTKNEVDLQFPELRHDVHWLELSPRQRQAYQAAETEGILGLREMGFGVTRVHIFALITKLKLICNYDEISRQSCKLDFLQDSLDEITANGEKALIFSQYPHESLSKIAGKLERFNPLRFDGSVSARRREQIVDQFQQQEENDILLMGIRSGGMGITLTRANHVFHFDHWWNPAIVDQGSARVHRIGQQRSVFIHSLYTRDTIEERIDAILSRKRQLFQDVFGELEDNQLDSKLSDEELFGLFGLEPPKPAQRR